MGQTEVHWDWNLLLGLKITRMEGVEVHPELGGRSGCLGGAGLSCSEHIGSLLISGMETLRIAEEKSKINV